MQSDDYNFDFARTCFIKILYGAIAADLPAAVAFASRYIMRNKYLNHRLKDFLETENERDNCIRQLERLFESFDCLIVPVTATPAFLHKKPDKVGDIQPIYTSFEVDGKKTDYATANLGYTTPFMTSNPVVSMPIGTTKAGLPIGVQVVCGYYREYKLLNIVRKLQEHSLPVSQ